MSAPARPPDPPVDATAALLTALDHLRTLREAAERAGEGEAADRLGRQVQRLSFRLIGLRRARVAASAGSLEAAALLQALNDAAAEAGEAAVQLEQVERITRSALALLAALERPLLA